MDMNANLQGANLIGANLGKASFESINGVL